MAILFSSWNSIDISDALYQAVVNRVNSSDDCRNLFVRKVPFSATSDDLRQVFEPFGTLVDCTVITDRETKASRGYAFVKYRTATAALKAMNADINIQNTKLLISFACLNSKRMKWK